MSLPLTAPSSVRRETRSCKVSAHVRTLQPKPSAWDNARQDELLTGILVAALEAEMNCFDAEAAA